MNDLNQDGSLPQEAKSIYSSNNPLKFWWFVIKCSLDFKGRSPRKEYWMFYIGNIIVFIALLILLTLVLYVLNIADYKKLVAVYSIFVIIWRILLLLPGFSLATRRFHDTNKSGWLTVLFFACNFFFGYLSSVLENARIHNYNITILALIVIICIVIDLWLFIILGFFKGENGPNQYGPNPLD